MLQERLLDRLKNESARLMQEWDRSADSNCQLPTHDKNRNTKRAVTHPQRIFRHDKADGPASVDGALDYFGVHCFGFRKNQVGATDDAVDGIAVEEAHQRQPKSGMDEKTCYPHLRDDFFGTFAGFNVKILHPNIILVPEENDLFRALTDLAHCGEKPPIG